MNDGTCRGDRAMPVEIASNDLEVVRAALTRESSERRRAECRADMQNEIVNLALDLLVREPDIEGFFGALAKAMVEESESHTCGVWLIDDDAQRCDLWMVYVKDRLYTPRKDDRDPRSAEPGKKLACSSLELHLFEYRDGWTPDRRVPRPTIRACRKSGGPSRTRWTPRRSSPRRSCSAGAILAG